MDLERFKELPLMGILRGIKPRDLGPVMDVSSQAGLRTIEITMNTPGAAELIEKAAGLYGGRLTVGAGTVLSMEELELAINAGASFIVMPVYIKEIVDVCREKEIPVFPGALTPLEAFRAWQGGASMVKIFPSGQFGPRYFKALKGPFDKMKLMAVGGVDLTNIKDYFASGADAVAFGEGVYRRDLIERGDLNAIGEDIRRYVEAVRKEKDASHILER